MIPHDDLFDPADAAPAPFPDHDAYLPPINASRRADGWSAATQRIFLEAIAEGHGVAVSCMRVGLSVTSAYAFRRTAKGAAFALGWRAASLVARETIAETLLVRALDGQTETCCRADGSTVTRHRHDNRLAMSLLSRLDRQMESAPDADVKAARVVAQEFHAFLDLVEEDGGPARAGLFLARRAGRLDAATAPGDDAALDLAPIHALAAADRLARTGVATAQEVSIADLDPARRDGWTADQWLRAEAAGLVAFTPPPAEPDDDTASSPQHSQHSPADSPHVWWDDIAVAWRTDFPPPADFTGFRDGWPGAFGFERALTAAEAAVMGPHPGVAALAALTRARDAFFGTTPPVEPPAEPPRPPFAA